MKRLTQFQSKLSSISLCLSILILAKNTHAQASYWNPQGSDATQPYVGNMSGTWEDALWATSATGQAVTVNFVEGSAPTFGVRTGSTTPAYTVTANSDHTIAGIANAGGTVTINGAGTLNFSGSPGFGTTGTTIISNVLAGTGKFVAVVSGTFYLMGSNTYSGGTQLGPSGFGGSDFGGALHFNNSQSFGTGPITMARYNNGTLVAEGSDSVTISNSFVGTNGQVFLQANAPGAIFSGPWSTPGTNILKLGVLTPGNTVTISGSISGTGGLEKFRFGTLVLSGANTFSGPLFVDLGTLSVSADNNFGQIPSSVTANAITISNATLNVSSSFTLNANRGVTLKGGATFDISNSQTLAYGGILGGGLAGLIKTGSGTLLLSGANTIIGTNSIVAGTLALTNGATMASTASMYIGPGATFDASGLTSLSYSENGNSFNAAGSALSPAFINGPAGGNVTFNPQTINLSFTPSTFKGDLSHPALIVSQGALTFSNNTTSVNITNAAATPLGPGLYLIVQVGDGTHGVFNNGLLPNLTLALRGTKAPNTAVSLLSSNGNLYLNVKLGAAFSNLTTSQTNACTTPTITLSGRISQNGNYPAMGETVSVTIRNVTQTTTINDSTGDFSIAYNSSMIPVGSFAIIYSYAGPTLSSTTDNSTLLTVTAVPLIITANNRSKMVGQTLTDGGTGNTNFTATGLVNGETVGSVSISYLTNSSGISGALASAPVAGSPYVIKPSQATGGTFTPSIYSISYVNGVLSVYGVPASATGVTLQPGKVPKISFSGTPDQGYRIEVTDSLIPPVIWTGVSTNVAGSDGFIQYNDMDATNHPKRFYRTVTVTVPH